MGKEKRKEGGAIKSIKTVLFPAKGPVKRARKNKQIVLQHRYSTCFAAMLQNKLHVFVARFNEAFVCMPGTDWLWKRNKALMLSC